MSRSHHAYNLYDLQHGWQTISSEIVEDITFEQKIEWYWGDPEVSAVQVILSEGFAASVFAQVTVWFRGVGTVHYVADAASLSAYIAKVLPGVQAMATQEYLVIPSPTHACE
jgi:hypothetical protein